MLIWVLFHVLGMNTAELVKSVVQGEKKTPIK